MALVQADLVCSASISETSGDHKVSTIAAMVARLCSCRDIRTPGVHGRDSVRHMDPSFVTGEVVV